MKYGREIAVIVAVLVIAVLLYAWHDSQMRALKAEVTVAMLQQQRAEVKQETAQKVQEVQQERQQAKTPAKQIEYVERYIPIHMTSLPVVAGQPPDAPSASIAQQDLTKLADYVAGCETCKVERAGLQKQVTLCDEEVKALEKRKGGFWTRTKWFIIGGMVGIATGYVASR